MSNEQTKTNNVEKKQKSIGLWAAGIFAVLGLAFLIFWTYNVVLLQKGNTDLSDQALLPVTILMFLAGLGGFLLIRRNRLILGLWLVYLVVLIPPVMAVLVIENVYIIAVAYLAVFAPISITWVFPRASRRAAIIAAAVAFLAIVGIEFWKPAFRVTSTALANFAPFAILLGGLGLIAFAIRQAMTGNIRTKLIVAFMAISIVSVGVVAFMAQRSLQTSLTTSIGNNLYELANARGSEISMAVDREKDVLETLSMSPTIQAAAKASSASTPLSQGEIARRDQQWRAADAANNNADPLVAAVLNNDTSDELRSFQEQFTQHVEVFLTNVQGVSIATTNRTSDYLQADEEWWQTTYKDGLYIGQPEYDDSTKTIAINMAVVLRDNRTGNITGILRTTVNFTTLTDTLALGLFGKTGHTNIYLPSGQELKLNVKEDGSIELIEEAAPPEFALLAQSTKNFQEIAIGGIPILSSMAPVKSVGDTAEDTATVSNLNWRVVVMQDQSEALQPLTVQTRSLIVLAIALIAVVAFAALGLARVISGPIIRLNTVAQTVATGDLNARATVNSNDEIGQLAKSFNNMTSQLGDLVTGLEQRVADRTKALATSSEVSRRLSTILNREDLVTEVVNQARNAFGYYHVQIYFYDDAKENLVMAGGTGEAGEKMLAQFHKVMKGRGLVGHAAENNQPVLVSDTTQSPEWLPNPLLPETKSEAAIPISIGDEVLGVLDVQQNVIGGLQQEDVDSLQAIANQVAIALQNIQSTEIVAKRAKELQTVAAISTTASTISDVQKMLESVVHQTQRQFGLYHAHVFIYNEDTTILQVTACGWKAGDEHEGTHGTAAIPLGQEQSLVARAGRTRQAVIVNDVQNEPGWLPNPLLPDTRAELAVPMIIGGQLLGVLDVQSDHLNAFTEEDASIQTTLASQVAAALQNARSFVQAQSQAERETTLNLITQKIQSATTIEAALQTAARELGHALGKETRVQLDAPAQKSSQNN